jgi:Zn-dependent metalloprotease
MSMDTTSHVCSFVPPHLLQAIVDSVVAEDSAEVRLMKAAAQESLDHSISVREHRASLVSSAGPEEGSAGFVQPQALESIARSEEAGPGARDAAQRTLRQDGEVRQAREGESEDAAAAAAGPRHLNRRVYSSEETFNLQRRLIRSEGQPRVADRQVNDCYDGFEITFNFFYTIFGRNSVDNNGGDLIGNVHYGHNHNNAYWNGTQMLFGDGDGIIFDHFTDSLDVVAHELTHGVTQNTAGLIYQNQAGALNESISDAFACMVEQWHFNQTAVDGDWLLGQGIFSMARRGPALRSLKAPGTAYNDPLLGRDPQPSHMRNYNNTTGDNGGVHINSGIPNHAFYLIATRLGGYSWDRPGKIWYVTLTSARLKAKPRCTFKEFAELTVETARALYGVGLVQTIVRQAWVDVGVL